MQRSNWKAKAVSVLTTAAMTLGMLPLGAFGATADTTIKVTGIDPGDSAAYYQVIQQNTNTKAWELTSAFSTLDLTQTATNKATNDARVAENPPKAALTTLDFILDGISADEAALIAALAGTKTGDLAEDPAGTFSKAVDPGMYLVLVTPANDNKDVVYKPIIVSADYDQDDSADGISTIAADTAALPTPEVATAKKSPLTLDKTATQINDGDDTDAKGVAVGDTVQFTVTSCVPTYSGNFTNPVYKISDVLSDGLTLLPGTDNADITVAVDGYTVTKDKDYTITSVSDTGFTVNFLNDDPTTTDVEKDGFLYKVTGNPTVTITYKAKVTSDAPMQVNEMDNTVKLNFSNNPGDTSGQGELEDKTRHYTFDIDGSVIGNTGKKTDEIIKVSLDANGEPVYETTTYDTIPAKESPLNGATFELRTNAADKNTALKFTNGVLDPENGSTALTSAEGGYITMKGLDEGIYYLVETSAPAGYSFDPTPRKVQIAASYSQDADGYDVLKSYTITVTYAPEGGDQHVTETTYTVGTDQQNKPIAFKNNGTIEEVFANENDNNTALIVNTKLGLLPSTGGSGIFFYLGVGGAIALVALFFLSKNKREIDELTA